MLLEKAAAEDNLEVVEWLIKQALVSPCGHTLKYACGKAHSFLVSIGCPRLPVKKEWAVVTYGEFKGEKGIVIGIDVDDGILKFLYRPTHMTPIRIIPMRHLAFCTDPQLKAD